MSMASANLWLYRALVAGLLPVAIPTLTIRDRIVGKTRPSFTSRLAHGLGPMPAGGFWLHAVSVGEVEIARRLARELEAESSPPPLVLTATTATGLELARRTLGDRAAVAPCPLDLPTAVGRFLDTVRPRVLAVVETELWPEMLYQTKRRGIPSAIVNARLSDASFRRYLRVRRLLGPLLAPLDLVLARSQADAERFSSLGVPSASIRVTGNVKYDLDPNPEPLSWAEELRRAAAGRPVVVAGSTMDGEEDVVLDAVARCRSAGQDVLLVLAPRHPERFDEVARLVESRGLTMVRRSADRPPQPGLSVFLLDTIGELARAYRLAVAAFVGGSFVATGGHNPLEPAVWGVPVLSGPHVFNFAEVYDEMTAAGAAMIVPDGEALAARLGEWLGNPRSAGVAGAAGRAVVEANRGATRRTVGALVELDEKVGRG